MPAQKNKHNAPDMKFPVKTVDEAYRACDPDEALEAGDQRYVDLNNVRGKLNLANIISKRIERTGATQFHQELISGHRGSGKSTELRRLQAQLKSDKYFAVYLDVESVLDLGEIKYQDVLIALAQAVSVDLSDARIEVDGSVIAELRTWFDERILTEEQKRDLEATLKTEAGVEGRVPFLAKVTAALTAQIRSGSSQKREIRHKLEQELSGFILLLNLFLGRARAQLKRHGFADLVILVDGLEKMLYQELPDGDSSQYVLFFHHASQLRAPQCHLIYTVPISLAFRANLGNAWPGSPFILPMVDYKKAAGKDCLREVVRQRVQIDDVFESPTVVDILIDASGGSIRDLMRLVRMACDFTDETIRMSDAEQGIAMFARDYDRLIRSEDLPELVKIVRDNQVELNPVTAHLLEHRLVHEFQNGERWADLHPMVRRNRRVERVLNDTWKQD